MKKTFQVTDWPRDWTPPDGLGYSRMRPVRLTRAGIALLVIAAALVAGGLAGGIAVATQANRQARERRLLSGQGELAEAKVIRLWRTGDENRQPQVAYRFTVSGQTFQGQTSAPLRAWTTLKIGSPLPVRFAQSNPAVNHPADWEGESTPVWLAWLVAVLMAVPAAVLAGLVRRQARLLSEGRAAPGVVTRHSRADHGKTRNHYQFRLLNGAVMKGRGEGSKPLPLGSTICVLYDPDNPRRNTPYPCNLVRLENLRATSQPQG